MPTLADIKKNWGGLTVITGIMGATLFGYNYVLAQAKDVAKTEVQATVNKEMVDGAKKAAKEAVAEAMAEQKEEIKKAVREAAKEGAKEVIKQQKEDNR